MDQTRRKSDEPVAYDADQMLLAFLGGIAFVMGTLFWFLLALRLGLQSGGGAASIAMALVCQLLFMMAWGVRAKMERALPLTRWEVRRLLIAGLVFGVVLGALPYLALGFKLEDPDVLHVATEPSNLPPAWR